jgi:hypothetical protein
MKAARIIGVWFVLACVAVGFGFARESLLTPALGELRAHQAGTVLFSAAILVVCYAAVPMLKLTNAKQAWTVGAAWVVMTVTFEFAFGHYVAGHAWRELLADYNVLQGRMWLLVLLTTWIAPVAAYRLRHREAD